MPDPQQNSGGLTDNQTSLLALLVALGVILGDKTVVVRTRRADKSGRFTSRAEWRQLNVRP